MAEPTAEAVTLPVADRVRAGFAGMLQAVLPLTSLVELSEYTAIAKSCTALPTVNEVPGELMFRDVSVGGGGGGGGGVVDEPPPPQFEAATVQARIEATHAVLKAFETRPTVLESVKKMELRRRQNQQQESSCISAPRRYSQVWQLWPQLRKKRFESKFRIVAGRNCL